MTYIFQSTGEYLGFIKNNYLFSRDNAYLAWIDSNNVWNGNSGDFVGKITEIDGFHYVLIDRFSVRPIPKPTKSTPPPETTSHLPKNTPEPLVLEVEKEDAYVLTK